MKNAQSTIYCDPEDLPRFEEGSTCFQLNVKHQNRLLHFHSPTRILRAKKLEDVYPLLLEVEQAVESGSYAAGGVSYEAAAAFDSALPSPQTKGGTLAWFALYDSMRVTRIPANLPSDYTVSSWTPGVAKSDYLSAVENIRDYIAAGDCYQANYTFPMYATFSGNAWPYFLRLIEAHRCRYGSLLHLGDTLLCSASPELFFERRQAHIQCKPMKGTCERGLTTSADIAKAKWLEHSQKNRAENVMIVDMIRNDLGRIAELGSVLVTKQFEVEPYPTVHQMTSTVEAKSMCRLTELFKALFPCASITGAPKKRCMEIIQELEPHARNFYTGCTGFITPSGTCRFNVAIRTVAMDTQSGEATFGTGSGIIWDSEPEQEYKECQSKVRFLNSIIPKFQLLETIYGDGTNGYFLLDYHFRRLEDSAKHLSIPWKPNPVHSILNNALSKEDGPHKFRLLIDPQGQIELKKHPLDQPKVWNVGLAKKPVSSANPSLYHKTTYRKPYQDHLDAQPDHDDILLYNERNELTEFCYGNLVLGLDGKKYTPPVRCGLLNGTYRQYLLDQGEVEERVLMISDLKNAESLHLINSVRKWVELEFLHSSFDIQSPAE